jgi:hypothetical protein
MLCAVGIAPEVVPPVLPPPHAASATESVIPIALATIRRGIASTRLGLFW